MNYLYDRLKIDDIVQIVGTIHFCV